MSIGFLFIRKCQACGSPEERVFTDSWTGTELCLMCLIEVANYVTMSPMSEGDNLKQVLRERTDYEDEEGGE
jgi:hypothetical protein